MSKDPLTKMLADPERRPMRGAMPVVTVRPDDEEDYQSAVLRWESVRIDLERRGRDNGTIAELLRPDLSPPLDTSQTQQCWKAADPFVLRNATTTVDDDTASLPEAWGGSDETRAFTDWLRTASDHEFRSAEQLVDPERDIAKADCASIGGWVKLGRLSTHDGDRSRRLCFGVGEELHDDDHPTLERHRSVFEWASALLPALAPALTDPLRKRLGAASGTRLLPSNPIVYWNRPGGGALFHHDALPGYLPGGPQPQTPPPPSGQRGVVYLQTAGTTVWIALSIRSLAERCCEFMRDVVDGGAPWLFDTWVKAEVWQPLFFATRDVGACLPQLQHSDGGSLRPLIHGCLEFTGFLIDSGHAAVLHPGDAIALPNHGPDRTAMHSVYCGSDGPNVGFSIGLRADTPSPTSGTQR